MAMKLTSPNFMADWRPLTFIIKHDGTREGLAGAPSDGRADGPCMEPVIGGDGL